MVSTAVTGASSRNNANIRSAVIRVTPLRAAVSRTFFERSPRTRAAAGASDLQHRREVVHQRGGTAGAGASRRSVVFVRSRSRSINAFASHHGGSGLRQQPGVLPVALVPGMVENGLPRVDRMNREAGRQQRRARPAARSPPPPTPATPPSDPLHQGPQTLAVVRKGAVPPGFRPSQSRRNRQKPAFERVALPRCSQALYWRSIGATLHRVSHHGHPSGYMSTAGARGTGAS